MDLIGRYWHHILFAFVMLSIATVMARVSEFSSDFVKTASRKLKVNPTKYIFLKNAVEFIVYGRLVGLQTLACICVLTFGKNIHLKV
jgi:hypothetical protein